MVRYWPKSLIFGSKSDSTRSLRFFCWRIVLFKNLSAVLNWRSIWRGGIFLEPHYLGVIYLNFLNYGGKIILGAQDFVSCWPDNILVRFWVKSGQILVRFLGKNGQTVSQTLEKFCQISMISTLEIDKKI